MVREHEGSFEQGDRVEIGGEDAVIAAVEQNLRGGAGMVPPIGLLLTGIDRDTARVACETVVRCYGPGDS